jgi:hypothetical protein
MIKYAIMNRKRKTDSQKGAPGTEKDLSALYGSGKGLLQDQDAQEYVAGGRKDRMSRASVEKKRTGSGETC